MLAIRWIVRTFRSTCRVTTRFCAPDNSNARSCIENWGGFSATTATAIDSKDFDSDQRSRLKLSCDLGATILELQLVVASPVTMLDVSQKSLWRKTLFVCIFGENVAWKPSCGTSAQHFSYQTQVKVFIAQKVRHPADVHLFLFLKLRNVSRG
jgi:hypothetical protein